MNTFGSRLKAARLARAITHKELSRLSGIPISTISRLENDASVKDGPRVVTARALARALETEPGWLLLGAARDQVPRGRRD